jgi:hypothetical protein
MQVANNYAFTAWSGNKKTGFMPVTYSNSATCPDACAFKAKYGEEFRGCYADGGNVARHWRKIDSGERGTDFETLCAHVRTIPRGQVWRHNVAGDLAGENNRVDPRLLAQLVEANRGRRGYTYTHKPLTKANAKAIRHANDNGFTVNLSADDLADADRKANTGAGPVVVVLPHDVGDKPLKTPEGRTVVVCPAQTKAELQCTRCNLCAVSDRKAIVGFKAHGTWERKVSGKVALTVLN